MLEAYVWTVLLTIGVIVWVGYHALVLGESLDVKESEEPLVFVDLGIDYNLLSACRRSSDDI